METKLDSNFIAGLSVCPEAFFNNQYWIKTVWIILSEKLEEKKQQELEGQFFTEMPCKHYMEVTQLLLKWLVLVLVKNS